MKIAFLCGSCEPGVDGVGDYTLSLARSLSERGHTCLVIALHDRNLQEQLPTELSPTLACLRLASALPWRQRSRILATTLRRFQPHWISLQYVPYAFNRKGLPWRLLTCLNAVLPLARWHVMAHELWVDPDAGLSSSALAAVQTQTLRWILARIKPSCVHTSNPYYVHLLASIGIKASILPLFSNIPVDANPAQPQANDSCSLILFGSIHPEWTPDPLLNALEQASLKGSAFSLSFLSIGNAGAHGRQLWQRLSASMPAWMTFHQLGPLPASEISRHLASAHWGITTTPSHLLGKSGAVAAMLAHGLPVIVPRVEKTNGPWHQALLADQRFLLLDANFNARFTHQSGPGHRHWDGTHDQLAATSEQLLAAWQTAA